LCQNGDFKEGYGCVPDYFLKFEGGSEGVCQTTFLNLKGE